MTDQLKHPPFWHLRVKDVKTVDEFLDKYYKPDRYRGRGAEYAAVLLKSHTNDFNQHGYDIISHHDCVTGCVVALYEDLGTCDECGVNEAEFILYPIATDDSRDNGSDIAAYLCFDCAETAFASGDYTQ